MLFWCWGAGFPASKGAGGQELLVFKPPGRNHPTAAAVDAAVVSLPKRARCSCTLTCAASCLLIVM